MIIYSRRGGNTKKVAKAIQSVQKSDLFDISQLNQMNSSKETTFWDDNPSDVYFVGTGIYADHVGKDLRDFFIRNLPTAGMKIALFGTWIGRGNSGPDTLAKFEKYLIKHGATVLKPYYLCYGQMLLFKRDHPNSQDFEKAKEWTQKILESV